MICARILRKINWHLLISKVQRQSRAKSAASYSIEYNEMKDAENEMQYAQPIKDIPESIAFPWQLVQIPIIHKRIYTMKADSKHALRFVSILKVNNNSWIIFYIKLYYIKCCNYTYKVMVTNIIAVITIKIMLLTIIILPCNYSHKYDIFFSHNQCIIYFLCFLIVFRVCVNDDY